MGLMEKFKTRTASGSSRGTATPADVVSAAPAAVPVALLQVDPDTYGLRGFVADVLPSVGNYAMWRLIDKQHRWYGTRDELAQAIESQGDQPGVYYAVQAYSDQAVRNGNKDARTGANVVEIKCFYADFDAGEKKRDKHKPGTVYDTQQDARDDLKAAVAKGLPEPSLVVSSGDGLHVYWFLEDAVTADAWLPVAETLKATLKRLGLRQDEAVTSDCARILRPLSTMHSPGKRVTALERSGKRYSLENLRDALTPLTGADATLPTPSASPAKAMQQEINADILGAPMPDNRNRDWGLIAKQCPAAKAFSDGKTLSEPDWRFMAGVTSYCRDGEKIYHELSAKDPRYDRRETQGKLDGYNAAPPRCGNTEYCDGCAHMGKITTPVQLGDLTDAAPPGSDTFTESETVPECVAKLNERYALVRIGAKMAIADFETPIINGRGVEHGIGFLDISGFHAVLNGRYAPLQNESEKRRSLSAYWLAHPRRRQFEGLHYAPGEKLQSNILNLWQGFAVAPVAGDVSLWLRVLAALAPDESVRRYVLRWLAWKIQNPGGVPDTILIFKGAKGTGKNSLFDPFLYIFGRHAMLADDPELIAGRFTWHLMSLSFAVLDEAVFLQDPRQADRIKSRVTAKTMMFERKGADPVSGVNHCAYVMLTNHDHTWQATVDERRAVVNEVGDELRGQLDFWTQYHAWANGDGPAALLHYLQHVDLTGFNPRHIPKNEALRQQVERTALRNPAVAWWHQCLAEGAIRWHSGGIERVVHLEDDDNTEISRAALRLSFEQSAGARGRAGSDWAVIARRLSEWAGPAGIVKTRVRDGATREWRDVLPPLRVLRSSFTAITQVEVPE